LVLRRDTAQDPGTIDATIKFFWPHIRRKRLVRPHWPDKAEALMRCDKAQLKGDATPRATIFAPID
jgi:hypothetical protein